MASGQAGANIDFNFNKENSEKDDGIEAHDLATLLSRFEEATSSDDLNLPQAVNKTKWNIMKAKSAGNSPAVTPPATPPPSQSNRFGPIRLKTFTQAPPAVINNLKRPIQLTVVNPAAASSKYSTLASFPPATSSNFTKISTTSLIPPKPKIHIQLSSNSLPTASVLTRASGQHASQTVTSSPRVSPIVVSQTNVKNNSNISLVTKSDSLNNYQVVKTPVHSKPLKNCVQPSSVLAANTTDTAGGKQVVNVLRMPALDAASSLNFMSSSVKQIIPKKRVSTLPSAIEVNKKKKLETPPVSIPTSAFLPARQSTSLLAAHLTSPVILSKQQQIWTHARGSNQTLSSTHQSSNNLPAQSTGGKLSRSHPLVQHVASKPSDTQPKAKIERDEHTYAWSGPCFNNKTSQRIGLTSSVRDVHSPTLEVLYPNPFESVVASTAIVVKDEVVLEEGEVYVDASGNDIFSEEDSFVLNNNNNNEIKQSIPVEEEISNRVVCFDTGDKNLRRARKYRRRGLGNSPVREDKSDFFDKIPSHYTALSIPAKQIRKTVFESVSGNVGSQDHLAMPAKVEEPEEQGEYNKVPAHHRIFTNTSEEVEIPAEVEPGCSVAKEDVIPRGRLPRVRTVSSNSRHSGHSTSSHRSNRSGSRYSYDGRSSRSRSRSPAYSDHSQVDNRRGRPVIRKRRRNSSSQLSVSSSSSSGSSVSYCSTCGASLSRSRSRSFSSDSSRERSHSPQSHYSRSRSRSPRRSFKRRRSRSSRSFTPERPARWRSRSRSHSRSRSPFRRRRNSYRTSSRSRRHQLKERSSSERKIMEIRKQREDDKVKAMEERRVLYVGKLPDNYTKHQLRKRFECFGEILSVRLNFRVHGDNYGFVTFTYACDAFAAKEKGNSLAGQPKFDLCFGGRRRFCPDKYADLDGNREIEEEYAPMPSGGTQELDYAALLKQHVSQQKKRR